MTAKPWMKFYPQDWRADERLRMCSLASRGLWMEMLAVMHRSENYGQLSVNSQSPTDTQLAVLVGAPSDEITNLISELETAGVFSRTRKGVIYSRRMIRDDKKARNAKKNGTLGGNPRLSKQRNNPASDNPKDKGEVKAQRPEARTPSKEGDGTIAKQIFDMGVGYLTGCGLSDRNARSVLGKWRKERGDKETLSILMTCQAKGVSDPVAYERGVKRNESSATDARQEFLNQKYGKAA